MFKLNFQAVSYRTGFLSSDSESLWDLTECAVRWTVASAKVSTHLARADLSCSPGGPETGTSPPRDPSGHCFRVIFLNFSLLPHPTQTSNEHGSECQGRLTCRDLPLLANVRERNHETFHQALHEQGKETRKHSCHRHKTG